MAEEEASTLLFLSGYGVAVPVAPPPLPVAPAITPSALRAALADALPEALRTALGDQLSLIAGLLDDIRKGQLSSEDLQQALAADPALAELSRALAGREVQAGSAMIRFGAGAWTVDIHMRDTDGRDLVRLTLHTGDVYHFYNAQVFH